MRCLLITGFLLAVFCTEAQYTVDAIPDSIRSGADVVFILDEGRLKINNDGSADYTVKSVIAILNPEGQRFAVNRVGYDKLRKVKSFRGEAFDANGSSLKVLKKNEIRDMSAASGYSIYEDNRMMIGDLRQIQYPYIVQFEQEIAFSNLFSIPDWYMLPDDEVGVMLSRFVINSPKDKEPQYKVLNSPDNSTREINQETVEIKFEYRGIKPIQFEPHQPSGSLPHVLISPSVFDIEGYEGKLTNWKSFGEWQNKLNEGRDDLPSQTINEIKAIGERHEGVQNKVKATYEYVQNNTRYVSIQLGIGGWQPFPNSVVDEKGYGDCKALTFYTQSLLKSQGIESHYTWVYAGRNPPKLDPDFPVNQFNHIILCVPNEGDTLWLECTSQTNPFGYLGSFTGNRDVLMITDSGGVLGRTPYYPPEVNTLNNHTRILLDSNFHAVGKSEITYAGLQYENGGLPSVVNQGVEEQNRWIEENVSVPGLKISDLKMVDEKKPIPEIEVNLNFESSKLVNPIGKRHFIQPNLFNRWSYIPEKVDARSFDIEVDIGYLDYDSIVFEVPSHIRPEFIPEESIIESAFGRYYNRVDFSEGKLIYVREMLYHDGTYDKSQYDDFRKFLKAVSRRDKLKIAFISKT